jgi:sulfate adenylyltransferase
VKKQNNRQLDDQVKPHGGILINRLLSETERKEALINIDSLRKVQITDWSISDLEMIAVGAYSPLTGFMNSKEYHSVLNQMRLTNGFIWTLPITLPIEEEIAVELIKGEQIALIGRNQVCYALLDVEETYRYNPLEEAQKTFQTTDAQHPGVNRLFKQPPYYLAGKIKLVNRPKKFNFHTSLHDPLQTRAEFMRRNWKTIVGFQTRNPIHRAHEYIQKCALEMVDGLFIHPLVGETKKDDIPSSIRIKSYRALLDNYYPLDRVHLSGYPAAMRYAGPREAVIHALVRKNYGCTHFIVGRDHAGVGSYYNSYDSQKIFQQFNPKELGILPLFFEHSFYCNKCQQMTSAKTCPHSKEEHVSLSGTIVRSMLKEGKLPPPEITRPEVAQILTDALKDK